MIEIIKPGILDTLQDEGRFGYQHIGINPNGVMDDVAANVANILVGNKTSEAAMELHFPASTFCFKKQTLIALTGADFQPVINDIPAPINTPLIVAKNSILKFVHANSGYRSYMAINGGFKINNWLNSYSTNLKAATGGFDGRPPRKGDIINLKDATYKLSASLLPFFKLPVTVDTSHLYNSKIIRCIPAKELNVLTEDDKQLFIHSTFKITAQSDRMGYRLQGPALENKSTTLLSSAVAKGTVQLLPSGQLIVLMADHQTTGGYPKIANVISADIPSLAQMRPNEGVQFTWIDIAEAEEAYIRQQAYLQQLQKEFSLKLRQIFTE